MHLMIRKNQSMPIQKYFKKMKRKSLKKRLGYFNVNIINLIGSNRIIKMLSIKIQIYQLKMFKHCKPKYLRINCIYLVFQPEFLKFECRNTFFQSYLAILIQIFLHVTLKPIKS